MDSNEVHNQHHQTTPKPPAPEQKSSLPEDPASVELLPIGDPPPLMLMGKRRPWKLIAGILGGIVLVILLSISACFAWYQMQQQPVSDSSQRTRLVIREGMGPHDIAVLLKQYKLIRSTAGFDWYTKINNNANKLQAGVYSLSPNMSLSEIVASLVRGKTDSMTITFLPGATLADNIAVLREAGYTAQDIETGLAGASRYKTALFGGKPATADLEGYIYGETYQFSANTGVQAIIERTLDEFMKVVARNNLKEAFSSHGLTLFEGITLASIIQREMSSHTGDMPQVAQVFYLRLKKDMPLGSDVTYEYAAKKLGVAATPDLKSPYNTRIHGGLPPGPIATPGLDALLAVARPASGDYLYFLSGDDGKTYFAKTNTEHEANIKNYCKKMCAL